MKKILLLLLPVWMLLSLPVQAFAAKSEFDAAVLLNDVGAVIRVYELGDKVTVESQQGDYYVLSDGTLVEKWLLRLDTEELPEGTTVRALADAEKEAAEKAAKEAEEKAAREAAGETVEETAEETAEEVPAETPAGRTVYAKNREETPLYDNVYCEGEPLRMLEYNQELVVEDEFGKVMRVMMEEEVPVPEPEEDAEPAASPEPAETAEAEETEPEKIQIVGYVLAADTKKAKYGGGGGDGGGGGGGGGGADGGEISLTNYRVMPKQEGFVLLANVTPDAAEGEEEEEPFVGGPGMILGKGAEGYACIFQRGDIVKVTEKTDKRSSACTIMLEDGRPAAVRRSLLYFKSDRFYQAWTGYTKNGALFYQKWRTQLDDPKKLAVNTELQVIGRFEDFNIVQLEDETIGLVSAELLSLTKVAYGGGGDGGGGGGGGGEWTAPVM